MRHPGSPRRRCWRHPSHTTPFPGRIGAWRGDVVQGVVLPFSVDPRTVRTHDAAPGGVRITRRVADLACDFVFGSDGTRLHARGKPAPASALFELGRWVAAVNRVDRCGNRADRAVAAELPLAEMRRACPRSSSPQPFPAAGGAWRCGIGAWAGCGRSRRASRRREGRTASGARVAGTRPAGHAGRRYCSAQPGRRNFASRKSRNARTRTLRCLRLE